MYRYRRHLDIDLSQFDASINDPETKYGLPQEVKFCASCVISNQRPNSAVEFKHTADSKKSTIHFDEHGVCDACRVAEQKRKEIDWTERERKLRELCDKYRRNDGHYDCLVPGSGGKDSFYAAHVLKNKYDMHPLTVTWAPHIYTEWGWKNFQSWIACRLRQLPLHAERPDASAADAARGREPVPPVPAVHPRAEELGAEDGAAVRHPAGVLRRERGRVRQPAL